MLAADGVPVVGGLSLTAKAYVLFDGDELSAGLLIVAPEYVLTATTIKFPAVTFDANARAKEAPPWRLHSYAVPGRWFLAPR